MCLLSSSTIVLLLSGAMDRRPVTPEPARGRHPPWREERNWKDRKPFNHWRSRSRSGSRRDDSKWKSRETTTWTNSKHDYNESKWNSSWRNSKHDYSQQSSRDTDRHNESPYWWHNTPGEGWQNESELSELSLEEFIKNCNLDDKSTTFVRGLPENVRQEITKCIHPKENMSWEDLFSDAKDIWIGQLNLHPRSDAVKYFYEVHEDAQRIVMMKFDPSRSKDGNVGGRLTGFLKSVVRTSNLDQGSPFTGVVPNCVVPEKDTGRILGDKGSTMKEILGVVRDFLGHKPDKHGHAPVLQRCTRDGEVRFELTLYHPFNNANSFDDASEVVSQMVKAILDEDSVFALPTQNCKVPDRIQPDDWECPNPKCRNLCFARRWNCMLCGAEKPRNWKPAHLSIEKSKCVINGVHWRHARRTPTLVTTKEFLAGEALEPGHVRVIWLVPVHLRGALMGKKGSVLQEIKDLSGVSALHLTQEVETEEHFGEIFVLAILTGFPNDTQKAAQMIFDTVGGRLSKDGFEQLFQAVDDALRSKRQHGMHLRDLAVVPTLKDALSDAKDIMRGAGLRTLMEFLERWPELFWVTRTGPHGATVTLADQP